MVSVSYVFTLDTHTHTVRATGVTVKYVSAKDRSADSEEPERHSRSFPHYLTFFLQEPPAF